MSKVTKENIELEYILTVKDRNNSLNVAQLSALSLESLEEEMGKSKISSSIEEYLKSGYFYNCYQCGDAFDDKDEDLNVVKGGDEEGEDVCDDCLKEIMSGRKQAKE